MLLSMSTDQLPYRPAPPSTGPARWLRALAGVREDVLDWVPEDRPRYTGLPEADEPKQIEGAGK